MKFTSIEHLPLKNPYFYFQVARTQTNGTGVFLSTLWSNPTEKELVHFRNVNDFFLMLRVTYYISKISPFKASLQYWTNEIFEKGFLQKWASDVIPNKNYSMLKDVDTAITLKLAHFEVTFNILLIGYMFALICLLWEIFYKFLDDRYHVTHSILFLISLLKPPLNIPK